MRKSRLVFCSNVNLYRVKIFSELMGEFFSSDTIREGSLKYRFETS